MNARLASGVRRPRSPHDAGIRRDYVESFGSSARASLQGSPRAPERALLRVIRIAACVATVGGDATARACLGAGRLGWVWCDGSGELDCRGSCALDRVIGEQVADREVVGAGDDAAMLLVPAVLELLGRHAWALPVSIERRLPTLQIHAEPSRVVGSTPSFTPGQEVAS